MKRELRSSTEAQRKRQRKENKKEGPTDINSEQPSRLLALPAELRVAIYEYAVLEGDAIPIMPLLCEPSLLHVSRQVRRETLGIWYTGSKFSLDIYDCDIRLGRAFTIHCNSLGFTKVAPYITLRGEPNWANLMAWCKWIASPGDMADCLLIDGAEEDNGYYAVITSAIGITEDIQDWERCRVPLLCLRHTAGRLDRRWLAG